MASAQPEFHKYVYWCTLCHVRAVVVGDDAKQLMDLIERAEVAGDPEAVKALTTCGSCQKHLMEANPDHTRRTQ